MPTITAPVLRKRNATANRLWPDGPATDRLRHQARRVAKDVQEMAGIASDAAQDKLGQWRGNAFGYYVQSRRAVGACRQFVLERPFNAILITAGVGVITAGGGLLLGRYSMRRIRARPTKSVFIAAGVGFVIGYLWTRRR